MEKQCIYLILFVILRCSNSVPLMNGICHDTADDWFVDDSCQLWYCSGGKPVTRMPPCSENMVYSKEYKVCVRRNSEYDDCSNGLIFAKFEDPCGNSPCINGRCLGSGNGRNYICSCLPGYAGIHCEQNIDDCLGDPCQNGGKCIDDVNDYKCDCSDTIGDTRYTGKKCETALAGIETNNQVTGCGSNPCLNGGLCIGLTETGSYSCSCATGYTGTNCEKAQQVTDVCGNQPCQNGGTCNAAGGTYTCVCTSGYNGNNCEIDIEPCRVNPCQNGGHCTKVDSVQSTCKCPLLYTGDRCQIDLDVVIKDQCSKGASIIAHPGYCQLYFNCSQTESPLPNAGSIYLNECIYPRLLNDVTMACDEAFTVVKCGNRKELKSGCDYVRNQYRSGHGRPCHIEYPNCEQKSDGVWMNPMKTYRPNLSPYYVICYKGRLIGSGMCGTDGVNERMMFYKPSQTSFGACTSLYKIPTQLGGEMPKCSGSNFQMGLLDPGTCNKYFVCFGSSSEVMKCPDGEVFQDVSANAISPCVPRNQACPPCGTKTEGCL